MSGRNGLIGTAELAEILEHPKLRLFDCTTYLEPAPAGSDVPYIAVPGRHTFEAGHIPGADFLDLQGEFSDQSTELKFMMPGVAQLAAAFGRHGISDDSEVVLYSIGTPMWATRFWWMLTSLGFENLAVLDGGLDKWKLEGRAIETGPAKGYAPATFTAKPKPGFFVDKHATLAATTERNTVVVNALGPQFHKGLEPSRYGRPGRVPGSCNVSAATLLDPPPRRSCRSRTPKPNSRRRALPKTSAWSPIAAAASRRPSTCSCCTGSATATSRSMTVRWANGRRTRRCRSRRVRDLDPSRLPPGPFRAC